MLQQARQRLREVQEDLRREKIKEQIYKNRYEDRLFKSNQEKKAEEKKDEPEEDKYDIFGSDFYVSPLQYETDSRQERLKNLKRRSASALNYLKEKNKQTVLVSSVPKPHHLNILQPAMRPIQDQKEEQKEELKEPEVPKKKLKRTYNKKILTPLQELIKYKKKLVKRYDRAVTKKDELYKEIEMVEEQIRQLQQ